MRTTAESTPETIAAPMRAPGGPLRVPAVPQRPQRPPFPLIASLAPVVAAVGIWALTQSPYVLIFAALGPVVAVAGLLDGRRHIRRAMRRARSQFERELAEAGEELEARQAEERRAAWQETPAALSIIATLGGTGGTGGASAPGVLAGEGAGDDAGRWQGRGLGAVCLGSGPVLSTVRLDTAGEHRDSGSPDPAGLEALGAVRAFCERAEFVSSCPVTASLRGGIAVVGPAVLARAVARGLLLQFARATHPDAVHLLLPGGAEWLWAATLPHSRDALAGGGPGTPQLHVLDWAAGRPEAGAGPVGAAGVDGARGGESAVIAIADSLAALPPGCATILRVDSGRSAVLLRAADGRAGTRVVPELVGREQSAAAARQAVRCAEQAGVMHRDVPLPARLRLSSLPGFGRHGQGLSCVIGSARSGPIELDLVAHGPHALVGGTTGSGKSELLASWVLALAAAYSPAELSVLLVDFKGGAAFGELAGLPHCVGLLTDLDEAEAARALASLQAELRHRERTLRAVRARDIADPAVAGQLPRLVIVVDEFAAMLGSAPELHAVFVDIAARGRSLGMHLVLCTQRPAGVLRDALLANCSLRLSLRVNNRADSRAVIGTDDAALLPPGQPGRAIVDAGDGRLIEFQSAISRAEELDRAGSGHRTGGQHASVQHAVRRPWLPPLPDTLTLAGVADALSDPACEPASGGVPDGGHGAAGDAPETAAAGTAFTLGVVDEPERQRRGRALWAPHRHGPLLVLGSARSGRSSVLSAIAEQAARAGWPVTHCTADDPEGYWDALVAAGTPDSTSLPAARLVTFDDWDAVLAHWPAEYQNAAGDLLGLALREGGRSGGHLALAASGLGGAVQSHRSLFDATLLLRLSEKSEHLRAGGRAATWRAGAPAGRGEWRGAELQCAAPAGVVLAAPRPPVLPEPIVPLEGIVLVVSSMPARAIALLRGRADASGVLELRELDPFSPRPDGAHPLVLVGDPDAWQARWGLFAELRPLATLVFHECRVAELRSLGRLAALPPLLARQDPAEQARAIAVAADGGAQRVRLA